jgi:hypothetical protein
MDSATIEYAVPHVSTTCKREVYTCIFVRIENDLKAGGLHMYILSELKRRIIDQKITHNLPIVLS